LAKVLPLQASFLRTLIWPARKTQLDLGRLRQ
jgi:hypothetical protein